MTLSRKLVRIKLIKKVCPEDEEGYPTTRVDWLSLPVKARPGNLRTLKSGDFSEEEIANFKKLYEKPGR